MTWPHSVVRAVMAASALASWSGCARSGAAGGSLTTASAPDTVRGIVSVVGSDPRTSVVLTPSGAQGELVAPRGNDVALLRGVAGLDVVLVGRRASERMPDAGPRGAAAFDMAFFVVRAADGQPATDGVLGEESGRYFLNTAENARLAIASLPPALQSQVGARVYLVGPLHAAPTSYGIIRARP